MKRTLALLGAAVLLAWTGLGLVAWTSVARHMSADRTDEARAAAQASALPALADELGALHQDVRALASGLGQSLQELGDAFQMSQDEHAAAMELRLAALRDEVGSRTIPPPAGELVDLLRELHTLRDALAASLASGSAGQLASTATGAPASAAEPQPAASDAPAPVVSATPEAESAPLAPPTPRARKSFLAFKLPSDDFRFDERRAWTVLPALSRVGFDAKTTLHDFTATTSTIEGRLEADLSRPEAEPRARLHVAAATLVSGDEERDEAMREHLAVTQHAELAFELTRFEASELDLAKMQASGRAHGRMRVRGVTRDVVMPVRLSIDAARRLCVEGEMQLDLTHFEVPVPSKLGLITMEKEVRVWISLRLRLEPRTEG